MPRKRFMNEQIAFALRQAENGATVDEVCRKIGVYEPTFYRWKKQFVGMGVPEIRAKLHKRKRAWRYRLGRSAIDSPNEVWAMDFMSNRIFEGHPFRILTVVDYPA